MTARRVMLVVADDAGVRAALARQLLAAGHDVVEADSPATAEGAAGARSPDVAVADLASPRDLLSLLHVLHERAPDLPVVVVTHAGGWAAAAEALRQGAVSAVPREVEPAALLALVARAAEQHAAARELQRLRRESRLLRDRVALLGRSERMREMSRQLDELAARATPALVIGATGTGKNHLARELHARSARSSGPFVTVACQDLDETLLASRLFGHVKGAFPGAAHDHEGAFRLADGGTLYLDGVDLLPLSLHASLLAALADGRVTPLGASVPIAVDVRLVSAAGRDPALQVRSGTFRDDLYRRISQSVMRLPTLAERPEDVLFLAEAFAAEVAEQLGVAARRFDAQAQEALLAHPWPGNVRELREAVREAFGRGVGEVIRASQLPASVRAGARRQVARDPSRMPTLAEAEADLVALVLEEAHGNKTEAARRLGIDRKRLYRKIRKYGLLGEDDVDDDEDLADED